ncbi:MAG: hypothetical protein QOH37_3257 [Nocardioidaceae bacterium]|nr:hypothetical protein [Nocardioidaceae bacterium]
MIPVASGELHVDGRLFRLVCVRGTGVAVYRGDGAFLRLGDGVAGELEVHRQMLRDGYPVAEILEVGSHTGSLYYIEGTLGEDTFGDACADRVALGGSMADEEFDRFLDVMRRHAHAQLAGDNRPRGPQEFAEFIGVVRAVANTPELAVPIRAAWEEAALMLSGLPAALQHGDLHPFNVCPGGIIDLEDAGWGPVGYDVATAVLEPTLAEPRWVDGALALEWFTPDQVRTYLDGLDEEFHRFDLPAPSTQIHAHLICRAINLGSRIHRNASVWGARQLMLARVLPAFLDSGRIPLAFAA